MTTRSDRGLARRGQGVVAVGVNYLHPRSGCEMWSRWDSEGVRADMAAIAAMGCNTVRVFCFWRDVEPDLDAIDDAVIGRFVELARLAGDRGLDVVPSLLTIWMNGQRLDLPWRQGRCLWTDPIMRRQQRQVVERIASALASCPNVVAYDLGDEVMHVSDDPTRLAREVVAEWQDELATIVRRAHPDALVMQANEASAVLDDHHFGPDNGAGLDLVALHGFPVFTRLAFRSASSPASSQFVGFLTRWAGAHGVPFVDELGTYGASEDAAAAHLEAAAITSFAAGATGLLVWCWQDISSAAAPYDVRPGERAMGVRRADGSAKPTAHALTRVAHRVRALAGMRPEPVDAAILLPDRVRRRDTTYLAGAQHGAVACWGAHLLARRAHLPHRIAVEPTARDRLVILPSVQQFTDRDRSRLDAVVERGGTVLVSAGAYPHGYGGGDLFGIELVDFTAVGHDVVELGGTRCELRWAPDERRGIVAAIDAEVHATFEDGTPALTRRRCGAGAAIYLNAPVEAQLQHFAVDDQPWEQLYRLAAAWARLETTFECDARDVTLDVLGDGRRRVLVAVNHGDAAVHTRVTVGAPAGGGGGGEWTLALGAKQVATLDPQSGEELLLDRLREVLACAP